MRSPGRSATTSLPRKNKSMETAAVWPCATAVMMFLGPSAESPPKNTSGNEDCSVFSFSAGMPHWSKAKPRSRSIQGKVFSWPMATSTWSQATVSIRPVDTKARLPRASRCTSTCSKVTPVNWPSLCSKAKGTMQFRMTTPSWSASSFSHGEAFISSKPERTMTCTSSAPRRRAERQQSMAVLPPPSTTTRRPTVSTWPNAKFANHSIPISTFAAASARPGRSASRPRGAPVPTKMASQPSERSAPRLFIQRSSTTSTSSAAT